MYDPGRIRSFLFVPADRPDRIPKAAASGAGAVIVDLEDAVAPDRKADGRRTLADALPLGSDVRAIVRVNGAETPWHDDDLTFVASLHPDVGVMLPKAENSDAVDHVCATAGPTRSVIALVETVRGVMDFRDIVAGSRIDRLAFGSADFCLDSGMSDTDSELDAVRTSLVLASRYAGLPPPIDGVTLDFRNAEQLTADIDKSRRFGFGGKLCIHPSQIAQVEAGYAPTAGELAWARRVVDAATDTGARAVDGQLVDRPLVDRARALLARAGD